MANNKSIAIIGTGIAGCMTAYFLKRLGYQVAIYERNAEIASGASGNPLAIVKPKLNADKNYVGQFTSLSYFHSVRLYDELHKKKKNIWYGNRGVIDLANDEIKKERFKKWINQNVFPDTHIKTLHDVDTKNKNTAKFTNYSGLLYPQGGAIIPKNLCQILTEGIPCYFNSTISYKYSKYHFEIFDQYQKSLGKFKKLIIATAFEIDHSSCTKNIVPNRGQITYLPDDIFDTHLPLTFGAYILPTIQLSNDEKITLLGATYKKLSAHDTKEADIISWEDNDTNLKRLGKALPHLQDKIQNLDPNKLKGRASVRATTKDHLPVVGELDTKKKGLYIISGLGSRGFHTASLCASILCSMIAKSPLPISKDMLKKISPERFGKTSLPIRT